MNTWGYLILIAALLLLAAAMLYARFASRSREKSLHHSPVELMFPADTISAARPLENETGKIDLPRGGKKAAPGIKVDRVTPPPVSEGEVKGEMKKRESDYFDELQEAAAGLAMLMRSSPVGRSEPVIYAPEEVDDEALVEAEKVVEELVEEVATDLEGQIEGGQDVEEVEEVAVDEVTVSAESAPVHGEITVDAPAGELVAEDVAAVEIESEIAPFLESEIEPLIEAELTVEAAMIAESESGESEECEVSLPVEVRVLTMREILGDQVSDRIGQIDEGLDALEALVRSIESSLRALDSVDLIDEDEDHADAEGTIVSEAA